MQIQEKHPNQDLDHHQDIATDQNEAIVVQDPEVIAEAGAIHINLAQKVHMPVINAPNILGPVLEVPITVADHVAILQMIIADTGVDHLCQDAKDM